jgi:aminopeptidase N
VTIEAGPAFTPGARTLGDPIFPQIGNGGYDAQHYEIDLDYDPAANVFDAATTTVTAKATQNLSEFSLDFQELAVSQVLVDGAPAAFSFAGPSEPLGDPSAGVTQPTKLVVTPASGILDGSQFTVEVAYSGEPALITDADASWEGWIPACYTNNVPTETCDGAFVVNEPIGAQGWFPSNNYPTDKATFDTIVTVPSTHIGLGIGELAAETVNGDGTTTYAWSEDDPSATYLTTATVGEFEETRTTMTETVTVSPLQVYNYIDSNATPTQTAAIQLSTDRQPAMLNFLGSEVFDRAYPFDSTGTVADKAAGVCYALEVQTKAHFAGNCGTGAPSVSAGTLLHEIAHQWVGNSVSPETWQEIWFNEGWATWLTWYWANEENGSPTTPAQQLTNNYDAPEDCSDDPAQGTVCWEQPPALIEDPADLFHLFPVYTRGAMTIEAYRQIVGEDAFFAFAGTLVEEFAYGNISTEEFIDLAMESSGLSGSELNLLGDFFDQWLYGTTKPTILPDDFA